MTEATTLHPLPTLKLKPGRDKALRRRHPWIMSGAIASVTPDVAPGETVTVVAADGEALACAAYSPASKIAARVWSFTPGTVIDDAFFHGRIADAVAARQRLIRMPPEGAERLVHAEADGLPGVVVDRYGSFLVGQFLSAGAERWKSAIVAALQAVLQPEGIYERSDTDARLREPLPAAVGRLAGAEPPETIEISLQGCRLLVDVRKGHKTGFYLDQRVNFQRVAAYARDAHVLNTFAYTGGFGLFALAAGAAHVINIDSATDALALSERHATLNNVPAGRIEHRRANVFELLRSFRDSRQAFDLIILDPPKFASSRARIDDACRGYKDINLMAIKLLKPGGILATFSCSGAISRERFQQTVAFAAADAARDVQILEHLGQAPDHPGSLNTPETEYLKGLICRAL